MITNDRMDGGRSLCAAWPTTTGNNVGIGHSLATSTNSETGKREETLCATVTRSSVTHRSVTLRLSAASSLLPYRAAVRHVQRRAGQCTQGCIPGYVHPGVCTHHGTPRVSPPWYTYGIPQWYT